jgi:hypothetical protein
MAASQFRGLASARADLAGQAEAGQAEGSLDAMQQQ